MLRNSISVFALLVVAALMEVSDCRVVPDDSLVYLGKFSSPLAKTDNHESIQATSFYFRSQNAAGWATAAADCRANLGDTATLVYIETDEELAEVTRFIERSDDTASTYWLGGKYDSDSGTFVWDNGAEINITAPWDQGHPNTKTPVTRVLAYTVGGLKFRTDFQTVSLRYLCELTA